MVSREDPAHKRELCHKHIPLAEDLHNIVARSLVSFEQMWETEVDQLFQETERARELYTRARDNQGGEINETNVMVAMLQDLRVPITKHLSQELRKTTSVEHM